MILLYALREVREGEREPLFASCSSPRNVVMLESNLRNLRA